MLIENVELLIKDFETLAGLVNRIAKSSEVSAEDVDLCNNLYKSIDSNETGNAMNEQILYTVSCIITMAAAKGDMDSLVGEANGLIEEKLKRLHNLMSQY